MLSHRARISEKLFRLRVPDHRDARLHDAAAQLDIHSSGLTQNNGLFPISSMAGAFLRAIHVRAATLSADSSKNDCTSYTSSDDTIVHC